MPVMMETGKGYLLSSKKEAAESLWGLLVLSLLILSIPVSMLLLMKGRPETPAAFVFCLVIALALIAAIFLSTANLTRSAILDLENRELSLVSEMPFFSWMVRPQEMRFSEIAGFEARKMVSRGAVFYILELLKNDGRRVRFSRTVDETGLSDILNQLNRCLNAD